MNVFHTSPFRTLTTLLLAAGSLASSQLPGLTINFDVNTGTSPTWNGTGVAPDTGTSWNGPPITGTGSNLLLTTVKDSSGNTVAGGIIYLNELNSQNLNAISEASLGNPNPTALMQDYLDGGLYQVAVGGIPEGSYRLYVFAHGEQAEQAGTVTIAEANLGGSATAGTAGDQYRNIFGEAAEGSAYLVFDDLAVAAGGGLAFTVDGYLNGFQLIRKQLPVIQTQPPAEQTGYTGLATTLSVEATGTPDMTYQWQKSTDGGSSFGNIDTGANPSAATADLSLTNLVLADSALYRVILTTPFGSETSTATDLTVISNPAPLFSLQPTDQTGGYGKTVTFSALAVADAGVEYQWYRDGQPISGATGATYSIDELNLDDAGNYWVVASNVYGSTESETATLFISLPAFPGADGPGWRCLPCDQSRRRYR